MVESNDQRTAAAAAPSAAGFFRAPGLFVRLSSKALSGGAADAESVWSPTSPLDFRSLRCSPPRVGLGLVDALAGAGEAACSPHLGCTSSFLDSIRPFLDLALPKAGSGKHGSSVAAAAAIDADSEEYTCVIARGANPRTTHILGGETLEVRVGAAAAGGGGSRRCEAIFSIEPFSDSQPPPPASAAASGRCSCCMKRLPEDGDIFMYLGEKAFCSNECRKGYIEEEIEEAEELMTLDSALCRGRC